MLTRAEALMAGSCPDCGGGVTGSLVVCEDHRPADGVCSCCGRQFLGVVQWRCGVCKLVAGAPSWAVAVLHPLIRGHLAAQGFDYLENSWGAVNLGYDQQWGEAVVGTDPLHVKITVTGGEETYGLDVDDTGTVFEVTT